MLDIPSNALRVLEEDEKLLSFHVSFLLLLLLCLLLSSFYRRAPCRVPHIGDAGRLLEPNEGSAPPAAATA